MGLSAVLNNALSGLTSNQSSLEVVSRNISNSGTPGYHAESMNVIGQAGPDSNYAIATQVTRAFDKSLQLSYNNETSDSAYAAVTAKYLNQRSARSPPARTIIRPAPPSSPVPKLSPPPSTALPLRSRGCASRPISRSAAM
jgi:flagellar basal body rod protein FlgB